MRTVEFFKYHGLGNDFVIVDAIENPALESLPWGAIAVHWCDRRTGIGADGVLLLCPPESDEGAGSGAADLRMRIINSDGSEAQMCGNGIRCIAKYMVEHRGWSGSSLAIQTGRGTLRVTWETRPRHADQAAGADRVAGVTVNMGDPILDPARIPVWAPGERAIDVAVEDLAAGATGPHTREQLRGVAGDLVAYTRGETDQPRFSCVSMGNPHTVIFVADVASVPLEPLGRRIEHLAIFPEMTNVHFVQVLSKSSAIMRTWERGAGATQACGTGACAVLVAAALSGRLEDRAELQLPGGILRIAWKRNADQAPVTAEDHHTGVYMTGPAAEVFCGWAAVGPFAA